MNEKNLFLTIDNGGTSTKVVIHDLMGKQLAVSSFPTKRIEEQPGFREIDLHNLWESIQQAIVMSLKQGDFNPNRVKAISVVGHGKGLYVLNHQGKIFMNGILSTDERAEELTKEFNQKIDRLWPLTNQKIVSVQAPILLNWLKHNQKEKYKEIGYILSAKDFIRAQLTGTITQELGDASGNNLINVTTKDYDSRIMEFFGIDDIQSSLPPLIEATNYKSKTTAEIFEKTGIPIGTPVMGGLFDIQACTLATGIIESNGFSMIAGTWSINVYPDQKNMTFTDDLMTSLLPSFFGKNKYLIEASSATSAGNLDIMLSMLLADEKQRAIENNKSIYEDLEILLETTHPDFTTMYYLPFLYGSNGGEGGRASFIGLTSRSSKSEMIKSVYEGIAFGHKQHIEQLINMKKIQPDVIRISGGATNSSQWVQLFTDIIGIPIETVEGTELGALGGMMLADYALGEAEISDVIKRCVKMKKRYEPRINFQKAYQKKYEIYQKIVQSLKNVWVDLNEINKEMENDCGRNRNL